MRLLMIAWLSLGPTWLPHAAAAADRAPPVDEIGEIPELAALRDVLADAVARRDTEAVLALAAPNIHLSFGGDSGRARLGQWLRGVPQLQWTGEAYWAELERALTQGSAGYSYSEDDPRHYCAPYTFYADFPDTIDPFEAIAFTRPDAPIHAAPDPTSEIIATLDYAFAQIVSVPTERDIEDSSEPYWAKIRTADGAVEGFALSTDFNSAVGYRACFSRDPQSGEWVWDAFIAGD